MKVCSVKELPYESRPVTRALNHGVGALTMTELFAVATGSSRLVEFPDVSQLMCLGICDLMSMGLSEKAAVKIAAVMELSKRIWQSSVAVSGEEYRTSEVLAAHVREVLRYEEQEQLRLLCFNSRHRIIKEKMLTKGTSDSSLLSVRELMIQVLRCNAVAIAIAHNHPSATGPEPSEQDISVTSAVEDACRTMGIRFMDHIIISDNAWYSFREHDLLS